MEIFLIFHRNGKPRNKFNHKGSGANEYSYIYSVIYDEKNDELFLLIENKIEVYNSFGKFQRSIAIPKEARISEVKEYDNNTLLIYEEQGKYASPFVRISKLDGHVVENIQLQQGKEIALYLFSQIGESISMLMAPINRIVKYKDGYLLTEFTNDTVFYYNEKNVLTPALTKRPSIHKMTPTMYVNSFVEAGNYQFFHQVIVENENNKLPSIYLMRDIKTNSVYKQKIVFDEYINKDFFIYPRIIENTNNDKIGFVELNLPELKEAHKNNAIKGKLRDLVMTIEEDSNNIYMLLHFK